MNHITFLNSLASSDFATAVRRYREIGIRVLDVKDQIFGRRIEDLTPELTTRAQTVISTAGCTVYCLSSSIGFSDLTEGRQAFANQHLDALPRLLETAHVLKPTVIRLLAPRTSTKMSYEEAIVKADWVFDIYRQMIDMITSNGFEVLLENEVHDCILASPDQILSFVAAIDRPDQLKVIYDVQNLWQMGWFPTVQTVRMLAPVLGGLHLKGGTADENQQLIAASSLEAASWPVVEMTRAALKLGSIPVICLNASHGRHPPGYDQWETTQKDLRFLGHHFPELQTDAVSA